MSTASRCCGDRAVRSAAGFAEDCDDSDRAVHPGAQEVCAPTNLGVDEDCDDLVDDADPSVTGQSVTVHYDVTAVGGGTPTGSVTVSDGTQSCTATVAAGQCTIAFSTTGAKSLTASYAGDSDFKASDSSTEAHTVDRADTTTTITSDGPDPSVSGEPVTVACGGTTTTAVPTHSNSSIPAIPRLLSASACTA